MNSTDLSLSGVLRDWYRAKLLFFLLRHLDILLDFFRHFHDGFIDQVSHEKMGPQLFGVYSGLYYTILMDYNEPFIKIPMKQPEKWKVGGFFS